MSQPSKRIVMLTDCQSFYWQLDDISCLILYFKSRRSSRSESLYSHWLTWEEGKGYRKTERQRSSIEHYGRLQGSF